MCVCYLYNAKLSLTFMVRVMAQFSVLPLRFYVNAASRLVSDDACVLDVRGKRNTNNVIFHFGDSLYFSNVVDWRRRPGRIVFLAIGSRCPAEGRPYPTSTSMVRVMTFLPKWGPEGRTTRPILLACRPKWKITHHNNKNKDRMSTEPSALL